MSGSPLIISPELAQDIEDAILIGDVAEIDVILANTEDDELFPRELRAGLEALRHFRAHYGPKGVSPPRDDIQKKKTALMETAWGAELLEMLRRKHQRVVKQA